LTCCEIGRVTETPAEIMAMTNPLLPLSKDFAEQLREQIRRMLARLDELRAPASNPNIHRVRMSPVAMRSIAREAEENPGWSNRRRTARALEDWMKRRRRANRCCGGNRRWPPPDSSSHFCLRPFAF
jgi:hypothetical protein